MNPYEPIPITLLDGTHTIRFTHGAIKRLEKHTGKSIEEFLGLTDTTDNIITLLWAGLLHEHVTPDGKADPTQAFPREALDDLIDVRMYAEIRLNTFLAFNEHGTVPEGNAVGGGDAAEHREDPETGTVNSSRPSDAELRQTRSGA